MSQRNKQSTTRTRATRHVLGVARGILSFRLRGLSYPVLIGFKVMKQHKKDELILTIVGSVILLTALYFFVKAIVGFDN